MAKERRATTPEFTWDALITYSQRDGQRVEKIIADWQISGLRCWIDVLEASTTKRSVFDVIEKARDYVLFFSGATRRSGLHDRLLSIDKRFEKDRKYRSVHIVLLEHVDLDEILQGSLREALQVDLSEDGPSRGRAEGELQLLAMDLRVFRPMNPIERAGKTVDETGEERDVEDAVLQEIFVRADWDRFGPVDRMKIERQLARIVGRVPGPRILDVEPENQWTLKVTFLLQDKDLSRWFNADQFELISGLKFERMGRRRPFPSIHPK